MGGEGMKEYICIIPLSLGARMYASCVCVCVCVCVCGREREMERKGGTLLCSVSL